MAIKAKAQEKDALKIMLTKENLGLQTEAEWDALVNHVEVHKYLINQDISFMVSWDDAVFSWYENVYTPLKRAIESWEVRNAFPEMTTGQLFFAVSSHWHYLKERDENIGPEDAATNFAAVYGTGLARWFSRFLLPGLS